MSSMYIFTPVCVYRKWAIHVTKPVISVVHIIVCVVTCAPWFCASISSNLQYLLYATLNGNFNIFESILLNKTCQSYSHGDFVRDDFL